LKITLIHYTYAPIVGGVEIVLAEHARLFADHGHEVTVLCQRGASLDPRIQIRQIPSSDHPETLTAFLSATLENQSVVFLHNLATMPFHLPLTKALWEVATQLLHTRFIAWIHDIAHYHPDYASTTIPNASGRILNQAQPRYEFIAISELRRRQWTELTGAPCEIIPNGLNPSRCLGLSPSIAHLASQHQLFNREILLLHPTRLLRRKNLELGLHVVSALQSSGRSVAYLITGPPDEHNPRSREYVAELLQLRTQLHLTNEAIFLHEETPVGDHDLASLFTLADALFFPSRQEGFGLPILEAALHRLPIFTADIEPLNTILQHGIHHFHLDDPPQKIATQIIDKLASTASWQANTQVRHQYAWSAIYKKYLAPLLARKHSRSLLLSS